MQILKSISIHILLFTLFHSGYSQSTGHILVVTNEQAKVIVDGEELGILEPNAPGKFELTEGEHYLQIITVSNNIEKNEILTIEAGKQKVLKYQFEETSNSVGRILVTDMDLNIPGIVTASADENFEYPTYLFAFEKGDLVIVNLEMSNKKGTNIINIQSYPDGSVLYSNDSFQDLKEHKVSVKERSIYAFTFGSNHAFDRDAQLKIERIPASEGTTNFNTKVIWKETYTVESVNKPQEFYIHSGSNATFKGGKSRIQIPLEFPPNTVKWYYTFAASRNESTIKEVSATLELVSELSVLVDQTGLLGFGIDLLNQPPGSDFCDVFLLDYDNLSLFLSKDPSTSYILEGSRQNIKSGVVEISCCSDEQVYLGIRNPDSMHGIHVVIEVAAIVMEEGWVISE